MKYRDGIARENFITSRSPHGERGLKYKIILLKDFLVASLPTRGAWIEIIPSAERATDYYSRSPHGERGLKCIVTILTVFLAASLPTRGAWIEIVAPKLLLGLLKSLPTRGAWIEISGASSAKSNHTVAPHTGSVD